MKKHSTHIGIVLAILLGGMMDTHAQGRLILNNNAYLVIDNAAYVVLDNPSPLALTTMGLGGNIFSEGEFDAIKWNIAATTGIYTIPFTTQTNNVKIPLIVNKTSAGTGTGYMIFSTYETATDMNTAWPSVVTNMYSNIVGGDGSLYVVDRFWRIDANSYTTKPNVNMTFTYDDNTNEIAGTNTILEPNLLAQRFNVISGGWDGLLFGLGNSFTNTVSGVNITDPDFFQIWTLTDLTAPLPTELLQYDATCVGAEVLLSWSTSTEQGNVYFTIERSTDGQEYEQIANIPGEGNSTSVQSYSFTDKEPLKGLAYYRLNQFDYNGREKELGVVAVQNCSSADQVHIYPLNGNKIFVSITSIDDKLYNASLFDALGHLIKAEDLPVTAGTNEYMIDASGLAAGVYCILLANGGTQVVEKVMLH